MSQMLPPALLSSTHDLESFDCGEPILNAWLKKTALKNQEKHASRCFVICKDKKVIGYYTLSSGAIMRESAPKVIQRNMPESLPVVLLSRLAIDQNYHNQGYGKALLRDAMRRVMMASADLGIIAILVHALSEPAKRFYLSCGFIPSPLQPMTLLITLKAIRAIVLETH